MKENNPNTMCASEVPHLSLQNREERPLRGVKLFFLMMFLMGQLAGSPAQIPDRMALNHHKQLVRVFEYRDSLEGVHPFIKNLYPNAIAGQGNFYVFDLTRSATDYRIMAHEEIEMKIPKGIRAAFPLQFYDNKCAWVANGDVFDSPEGYVIIFHEFVHPHQSVEPGLRENLPLAMKASTTGNFMWEINHPFPYQDKWFATTYTAFRDALVENDHVRAGELRQELASLLNDHDYQYMVWLEWKQGFALFLENKMRHYLSLPHNHVGRSEPYDRTIFYAGGAAYINYLLKQEPELLTDPESLFYTMYND